MHIVVTCTNRKRHPVPMPFRLGDLKGEQAVRFAAWTHRLGADEPVVPAADLYSGEHWQVAKGLPALVGDSARLWVCSAGYGLIAADTRLHPYAATFSPGDADSVGQTSDHVREWWRRLMDWDGPAVGQPRSFADLARCDPTASVVAVLSRAYLRACADDLREAGHHLADRDGFAIIGPPASGDDIDDLLVPADARLRPLVGGSLQALHVRVAAHLLAAAAAGPAVSRSWLRAAAREAAATAPLDPSRRRPGAHLTDQEVSAFILSELASGATSATALLRRLRDSGRSCEQSRFKQLYAATVGAGAPV